MSENLSPLSKRLAGIGGVEAVVLYGSHARGEAGRKSDVDLLVLVDARTPEVERKVERATGGEKSRVLSTVLTPKEFAESRQLAFNVARDGVVLFKRPGALRLPFMTGERSMVVYTFDISALPQAEKVKINRALYGGRETKKVGGESKEYRYAGIIEQRGGRRIGRGGFLVPAKTEDEIDGLFRARAIPFTKTWVIEIGGKREVKPKRKKKRRLRCREKLRPNHEAGEIKCL